jgi:hypothetical protein
MLRNNITIAFYSNSTNVSCSDGAGSPAGALTFTTPSYNVNYACFNLDELVSGNATGWYRPPTSLRLEPYQDGVNYTIRNQNLYTNSTVFNGFFLQSVNNSVQAGQPVGRQVLVYNTRDCLDVVPAKLAPGETSTSARIRETTCQTQSGGDCHTTPETFKSFRLGPSWYQISRDGKCKAYEDYFNSAASVSVKTSALAVAGFAVFAVVWTAL